MMNRAIAPPIHEVRDIKIPIVRSHEINGKKVFSHLEPGSGTFKIELLTKGSQLYARFAAEAQLSLRMLNEGTFGKTGFQLAEAIDSIGSFLEITPGFDYSSISLFGLSQYFEQNLQLLSEIMYTPRFDITDLEKLKLKEFDKLKMNLEKGSYVSSVNMRKALFGPAHPYGKHLTLTDIESLTINQVHDFHEQFTSDFDIYISGDLPGNLEELVKSYFDESEKKELPQIDRSKVPSTPDNIEKRDDKYIQTSIKLGKRLFTRSHPGYFKFIVTNEIFGGFFGSRLMKNIREEKGFTYGIYSNLYSLLHEGYFLISTDVKGEFELQTLDEIFKEAKLLRSEMVSPGELEIVKNYMIGVFVNSFASPFAGIDKFKTLNSQHIDMTFYKRYVSEIRKVQPEDVLETAQKYLLEESLVKSIVGA